MITSTNNQQIKNIKLLLEKPRYRRETGLFVVEGIRMFLETPFPLIEMVYASEDFMNKSVHTKKLEKIPHEVVKTDIFNKMSDTKAPQGILAVVRMPKHTLESMMRPDSMYLILNGVQDPGNLGTMLRTAEAAGAAGIIMDRDCADIFNPKVIRSTMGSVYRVPFVITNDLEAAVKNMKDSGVRMMAAHLKGQTFFEDVDYSGSVGIMIGNEGNGLSDNISSLADMLVKIPMEGRVESLNAAISAALFMYEVKRSRS